MKPIKFTSEFVVPESGLILRPKPYRNSGMEVASLLPSEEIQDKIQAFIAIKQKLPVNIDVEPIDLDFQRHVGERMTVLFLPMAYHISYEKTESYVLQSTPLAIKNIDKPVTEALIKSGISDQTIYEPVANGVFDFVFYPKDSGPYR